MIVKRWHCKIVAIALMALFVVSPFIKSDDVSWWIVGPLMIAMFYAGVVFWLLYLFWDKNLNGE